MPGLEKRPGRSVAAGPKGRRNAPSGRSADSETSARPPRSARQTRAEASDRCGGGSAREAGRNTDPVKCDGQPRFGPGTAKGQATVTSRRDASRAALGNDENQKIAIGKQGASENQDRARAGGTSAARRPEGGPSHVRAGDARPTGNAARSAGEAWLGPGGIPGRRPRPARNGTADQRSVNM